MNSGFEYAGNSIEIINYRYNREDAVSGNPYNCSFQIKIVSGNFSGLADYECDRSKWEQFVRQMELFYQFKCDKLEFVEFFTFIKYQFDWITNHAKTCQKSVVWSLLYSIP